MTSLRSYGEACGIPRALDRVGERWALLVARELMLGPKRFTDLRAGLPHASANVLSQRLRDLEEIGVLRRRKLPPPAAAQVYELTEWGAELEPVLIALGRWGARAPISEAEMEGGMSPDAHLLSLATLFDPALAGDFDATLELRLGEERFSAIVSGGELELVRGEAPAADATVTTDHGTLLALSHARIELSEALGADAIGIEGDERAVERFVGLFKMPEPAQQPAAPMA